MANEVVVQNQDMSAIDIFDDSKMIGALKVAEVISKAEVIPKHYRGKPADCLIAMVRSRKLGTDLFSFMECTYPVNGKLGFEGKYIIALVNQSGVFRGPLRWIYSGDTRENRSVICFAYLKNVEPDDPTKGKVEMSMTYQQAVSHGWNKPRAEYQNGLKTGEKPSPWETDTDQMLAYRSASYLARLYCPNVSLGMYEKEELFDIQDAVVVPDQSDGAQKSLLGKFGSKPPSAAGQSTESQQIKSSESQQVAPAQSDPLPQKPTAPSIVDGKTAPTNSSPVPAAIINSGNTSTASTSIATTITDTVARKSTNPTSSPVKSAQENMGPEYSAVSENDRLSYIETIKQKLGEKVLPLAEEYWHLESKNLTENQTINDMPGVTAKLIVDNWAKFLRKLNTYMDKKSAIS